MFNFDFDGQQYRVAFRHTLYEPDQDFAANTVCEIRNIQTNELAGSGKVQCLTKGNLCKDTRRKMTLAMALKVMFPEDKTHRKNVWSYYFLKQSDDRARSELMNNLIGGVESYI